MLAMARPADLVVARPAGLVVECLQADGAAKAAVSLGVGHVEPRLGLSGVWAFQVGWLAGFSWVGESMCIAFNAVEERFRRFTFGVSLAAPASKVSDSGSPMSGARVARNDSTRRLKLPMVVPCPAPNKTPANWPC